MVPIVLSEIYRDKKVLIAGGKGYIGSRLRQILESYGATTYTTTAKGGEIEMWENDLSGGIHLVIYLASNTDAYYAAEFPAPHLLNEVRPLLNMMEYLRRFARRHIPVVYAGSVTQVGMTSGDMVNERAADKPVTVYDIHKLTNEHYLYYYAAEHMLPTVTLRLANVYGPSPAQSGKNRNLVQKVIDQALQNGRVELYGDGNEVRDFVHIDDVCRALLAPLSDIRQMKGQKYIISSNRGVRIGHVVKALVEILTQRLGRDIPLSFSGEYPPDRLLIERRDFVGNSTAFWRDYGWRPEMELYPGLVETVEAAL